MHKNPFSDVPNSLRIEAQVLKTVSKTLRNIRCINDNYSLEYHLEDINTIGLIISQAVSRIEFLREHIECTYDKVSDEMLTEIGDSIETYLAKERTE